MTTLHPMVSYLEGQGDLVSRLVMGKTRLNMGYGAYYSTY